MRSKYRMAALLLVGVGLMGSPESARACLCLRPDKPPAHSYIRRSVDNLFAQYTSVVRVRASQAKPRLPPVKTDQYEQLIGDAVFEFEVTESWKGDFKVGDAITARSVEFTSCDAQVQVGDVLLVGLDASTVPNFKRFTCPEFFAKERLKLETRYLKRAKARYEKMRARQ